tara:strand:- start:7440 stop:8501 length:1062 start_codon:yes stop_codon:yes gene_type:complete
MDYGVGIARITSEKRKRTPLPEHYITTLKERLNALPKNTFKAKDIEKKHKWRKCKSKLPSVAIDLPIIYDGDEYEDIDYSCIVLDRKTERILAVFIYETEDPNIREVVENGHRLLEGMRKHLKLKKKTFYSGFGSKQEQDGGVPSEGQKQERIKRPDAYGGENYLDGLQRYLDPPTGRNVVCFYPRNPQAHLDEEYINDLLWVYCGLYELEKRHCPALADFRLKLAKKCDLLGLFPPVPIELNPSTCVGGSINFSNVPHNDSSRMGTTETIIWKPDENSKIPYVFRNILAKKTFQLNKCCLIYQVGTDLHNTMNTGNHGGVGFVNLSKSNLLSDTEFMRGWWDNWYEYFLNIV